MEIEIFILISSALDLYDNMGPPRVQNQQIKEVVARSPFLSEKSSSHILSEEKDSQVKSQRFVGIWKK